MKAKKTLSLDKLTISKLSREEMRVIMGGYSDGVGGTSSLFASCQKTHSGENTPGSNHVQACHC